RFRRGADDGGPGRGARRRDHRRARRDHPRAHRRPGGRGLADGRRRAPRRGGAGRRPPPPPGRLRDDRGPGHRRDGRPAGGGSRGDGRPAGGPGRGGLGRAGVPGAGDRGARGGPARPQRGAGPAHHPRAGGTGRRPRRPRRDRRGGRPMTNPWVVLVATVLLIVLSAFFVVIEFALLGARRHRLEAEAVSSRSARAALRGIDELTLMLAGAQLGITAATFALGAITKPAVDSWLGPALQALGVPGWLAGGSSFALSLL